MSLRKKIKLLTPFFSIGYALISLSLLGAKYSYAAEDSSGRVGKKKDQSFTIKQQQARDYRSQGFLAQTAGDLDSALICYQKAAELDPMYAAVHNDLGVIYESQGLIDRAEEAYLKAVKLDPYFLGAYSNLALLYEGKRDLRKAAMYWARRAEFGSDGDPWAAKAERRYADIALVTSLDPDFIKEKKAMRFMKVVQAQKEAARRDDREQAKVYFTRAKESFRRGDETAALKEAIDAHALDPSNKTISEFIDQLQKRVLTK